MRQNSNNTQNSVSFSNSQTNSFFKTTKPFFKFVYVLTSLYLSVCIFGYTIYTYFYTLPPQPYYNPKNFNIISPSNVSEEFVECANSPSFEEAIIYPLSIYSTISEAAPNLYGGPFPYDFKSGGLRFEELISNVKAVDSPFSNFGPKIIYTPTTDYSFLKNGECWLEIENVAKSAINKCEMCAFNAEFVIEQSKGYYDPPLSLTEEERMNIINNFTHYDQSKYGIEEKVKNLIKLQKKNEKSLWPTFIYFYDAFGMDTTSLYKAALKLNTTDDDPNFIWAEFMHLGTLPNTNSFYAFQWLCLKWRGKNCNL